jgi:hypothetical protein
VVVVTTGVDKLREQKQDMEDGDDEDGRSIAGKRGRQEWINPAMVYTEEYGTYVTSRSVGS